MIPPETALPLDSSKSAPIAPGRPAARKLSLSEALASARETKALLVGAGVLSQTPEVFRQQFPGRRAVVIADEASHRVAGLTVSGILSQAGLEAQAPFVFHEPNLYAEYHFVEILVEFLRRHDAIPVAVGSGTVNDLVKLASHRTGRPYLCVATAASMDGYTAFGASITFQGAKQTFDCPAPQAVIADLDVVCGAPSPMTASGYADLQAKITAGADWILADALGVEPIETRAWEIVQGGLSSALASPAGARDKLPSAIGPLIEGLMLGGFAMQWTKSSRPASGAEHQFSHLWDMEHHTHQGEAPSHGFKVGIATLAVTALYEVLLSRPLDRLDVVAQCARWPGAAEIEARVALMFSTSDFLSTAINETRAKHPTRETLAAQLERLRQDWPALRTRLRAQLVPSAELKRRMKLVGAPTEPEEIGISRRRLRDSFQRAYHIRRRFTVLDLAVRAGLLKDSLDVLFGLGGIWEIGSA